MCMHFIFCVLWFYAHFVCIFLPFHVFQRASVTENLHTLLLLLLFFYLLPHRFLCSHYSVSYAWIQTVSLRHIFKKSNCIVVRMLSLPRLCSFAAAQNVLSHSLMMAWCRDSVNSILSFYFVISVAVIIVEGSSKGMFMINLINQDWYT